MILTIKGKGKMAQCTWESVGVELPRALESDINY